MTLNDQILQIQMNLDQAKEHIVQLEAGRKSGAPKCRASLQKVKVLAHELRKACMVTQRAIPVKSRSKVTPTELVYADPVILDEPIAERPAVSKPAPVETPMKPVATVKKPRKPKKT